MLATLHQKIRAWRVQRLARRAFGRNAGFARQPWPISTEMTPEDWSDLADAIRAWYTAQLAQTATPYGINQYGALLRLAQVTDRRTVRWTRTWPSFQRTDAPGVLDAIHHQVRHLPLADHPTATHVEAHLISLGDILLDGTPPA